MHGTRVMEQENGPWRVLYTDAGEFPLPSDLALRAKQAGLELEFVRGHERDEIVARGAGCCGFIIYRAHVDDNLLGALPHCRVLARVGTGYDLIDVVAAQRRNIVVTYVPDICTEEMSESVLLFILAFSRQLPFLMDASRDHHWLAVSEIPSTRRLKGQTLGILGFGRSGRRTVEKAVSLGLHVDVWTRTPQPEALARIGAHPSSFEDVLACDFVSLHVPLTSETSGLIDRLALAHFKPTGVLINVARGAIVDTDALVKALHAKKLGGAALDVVEPTPLPAGHPLWDFPNVLITSHSACISVEALCESQASAIDDTAAVLQGRPPTHPVPELRGTIGAS